MPINGVKYLLVCVNVLSRFLRVEPMQILTSVAMKNVLVAMLNQNVASECPQYHAKKGWTDQGREFEGEFRKFCIDVGIHQCHTFSKTEATVANAAIFRPRNKLLATWKNNGCGATLKIFKIWCQQSIND